MFSKFSEEAQKSLLLAREEMIKLKKEWLDFSKSINSFLEKGESHE